MVAAVVPVISILAGVFDAQYMIFAHLYLKVFNRLRVAFHTLIFLSMSVLPISSK